MAPKVSETPGSATSDSATLLHKGRSPGQRRHRGSVAWAMWAALLVLARPVHAQRSGVVNVSVDATADGAPLERIWPFYGYDEINYTTDPEGRALLAALAAANTARVHVRSHFLFNSGDGAPSLKWGSTNVYTEDAQGSPVYSWALTDGILDAITSVGAFPFVEIGFMPQALSVHPTPYRNVSTIALNGGCFYPPTDYEKWADLIRTWALHANQRYANVAATWLWELWNEPDSGYWHGTFAEYAKLYDHTESALHAALPDAALGGPAAVRADGDFLPQFLQHCASGTNAVTGATGTRLDLVTFHAKGGVAFAGDHVQMNLGNQLRLHRSGFAAVAAVPQFKQTPIYITEADPEGCAACVAGSDPTDAYRTSPAYGAYEIAMMKHTLELGAEVGVKLEGVLTWAFTFPGTPYFAGYRALATNGIDLPVFSAFKLLGRLAGNRVPLTSSGAQPLGDILANGMRGESEVDGVATSNGSAVQVLVWNYHDDLVDVAATPVHLTIEVPASFGATVRVGHLRVDDTHGDAYAVWVAQGMPPAPSATQIAALQAAMEPAPLVPDAIVAVAADGTVVVDFVLPRFGVSLVTIEPAGENTGGAGVDAGSGQGGTVSTGKMDGGCSCGIGGRDGGGAVTLLHILVVVCVLVACGRSTGRRSA
jgi:xylan 1,4-beta-xylosidase